MGFDDTISRRGMLGTAGAGAIGIGAVALVGCGSDDGNGAPPPAGGSASPTGGAATQPIAKVADIPVGGSLAGTVADKPVALARPEAGKVVCFSAICTHQGCTVKTGDAQLHCPCHGSVFEAATGAVVHGPAPSPLPSVPVKVVNGEVLPS